MQLLAPKVLEMCRAKIYNISILEKHVYDFI
jgi:hypothetical protein